MSISSVERKTLMSRLNATQDQSIQANSRWNLHLESVAGTIHNINNCPICMAFERQTTQLSNRIASINDLLSK